MSLVAGMGSPTELRERIADYQQECLRQEQEITRLEGRCDDLGVDLAQAKRHIESLRQQFAECEREREKLIGRPIPLTEWQKMELQLATVTKERDELVEALKQFAECDLNNGNCASLEVATRRIRSLAQATLEKLSADKMGEK